MIRVTKTFLPPIKEFTDILNSAWESSTLTNRGSLVNELEQLLKKKLSIKNIVVMSNGTLPIQIAIKSLELKGEIITTPFSYVATTSSIVWEGCKPKFVDINPEYLTIDENKIEEAIDSNTSAILATHVYGNPCNVELISEIADRYNLKVIYDAAHCFGVEYKKRSIFNYGDISTCSFHATKIFHTAEGGAIFTNNDKLHEKFLGLHNFGHLPADNYSGLGINGKMSEVHAAIGLSVLPYFESIITERKEICNFYNQNLDFKNFYGLKIRKNTVWNYSFYPIVFHSEDKLLKIKKKLESNMIMPRRYFFPSLTKLPYINQNSCSLSDSISKRVLCLPIYPGLDYKDVEKIIKIINA